MQVTAKSSVFAHIPRTAGGSMRVFCNENGIRIVDHDLRNPQYRHLRDFVALSSEPHFTFTFVRNPWDRAVSAFQYLNKGGNNPADDADRVRFLARYDNDFDLFVRRAFRWKWIFRQLHFKPQHFWISDKKGNLLPQFIGRFENLTADFETICRTIGIEPGELIRKNVSGKSDYRDYYTERSRRIIEKAYSEDLRLFNYKF